ncbi:hypothetical protein [Pseudenhygromyxa sp. WMMC2535]|nr:hypothetical protein [Pseudenhygromyxa sp. WMMC2535]
MAKPGASSSAARVRNPLLELERAVLDTYAERLGASVEPEE